MNPDTPEERELPGKYLMTLKKGDLYRVVQAGGGGYGDPLDRDPYLVLEDVEQEKLTSAYARTEYGVVINPDTLTLDMRATEALRREMGG